MNPAQLETFRTAILNVLDERGGERFGLNLTAIGSFLTQYGFRNVPREQIAAELQYHCDKGLVAVVGKLISPENRAWRITAAGRDFLATNQSE